MDMGVVSHRLTAVQEALLASLVGEDLMFGAEQAEIMHDHISVVGIVICPKAESDTLPVQITTDWTTTNLTKGVGIDWHSFDMQSTDKPFGRDRVGDDGYSFPVSASYRGDPLKAVRVYNAEISEEMADGSAKTLFDYDKHICLQFESGRTVSMTTQHESILGALELRQELPDVYASRSRESVQLRKIFVSQVETGGSHVQN